VASLNLDPASGRYRILFRFGGRQFQKSLKTTDQEEAEAAKARIALTLRELENGRLILPPGADFWEFVYSDGRRTRKVEAPSTTTLEQLFQRYEQD
jgi:hypothetical protein